MPKAWASRGEPGFETLIAKDQPGAAPWYDRIPCQVTTQQYTSALDAPHPTDWPKHDDLFEAVREQIGWDLQSHVLIRHKLAWPIPLSYATGYIQF